MSTWITAGNVSSSKSNDGVHGLAKFTRTRDTTPRRARESSVTMHSQSTPAGSATMCKRLVRAAGASESHGSARIHDDDARSAQRCTWHQKHWICEDRWSVHSVAGCAEPAANSGPRGSHAVQRSQAREIMRWSGSLPCQWARAAAHLEEASSGSDAHSCLAAWIACGMRAQRLLGR